MCQFDKSTFFLMAGAWTIRTKNVWHYDLQANQ